MRIMLNSASEKLILITKPYSSSLASVRRNLFWLWVLTIKTGVFHWWVSVGSDILNWSPQDLLHYGISESYIAEPSRFSFGVTGNSTSSRSTLACGALVNGHTGFWFRYYRLTHLWTTEWPLCGILYKAPKQEILKWETKPKNLIWESWHF